MTRNEINSPLVESPNLPPCTFLGFPFADDLDNLDADIAVLGIPFGMPYEPQAMANDQSRAPDAIRQFSNSTDIYYTRNHYDWDLRGPLLDGRTSSPQRRRPSPSQRSSPHVRITAVGTGSGPAKTASPGCLRAAAASST